MSDVVFWSQTKLVVQGGRILTDLQPAAHLCLIYLIGSYQLEEERGVHNLHSAVQDCTKSDSACKIQEKWFRPLNLIVISLILKHYKCPWLLPPRWLIQALKMSARLLTVRVPIGWSAVCVFVCVCPCACVCWVQVGERRLSVSINHTHTHRIYCCNPNLINPPILFSDSYDLLLSEISLQWVPL